MKISGIYKIESKLYPNRLYIGSAIHICKRWTNHLCYLRKGKHTNLKLQRHYNKYGEKDLLFSIIIGCDKEDLIKIEQFFIDSFNPYFNICKVAGNSLGRVVTEITRKKLSESHIGQNTWSRGIKQSKETIFKRSQSNKGKIPWIKNKKHSKEAIEKIREASKRMWEIRKNK
jgi:group I intron endonuclease